MWHCIWFHLKLTNRAAEVKIINGDVSIEHNVCVINGFAEFMVNLNIRINQTGVDHKN